MGSEQNKLLLVLMGAKLANVRKAQNISYRKLAQMCKVDHSQISKLEKGEVFVQLDTLFDIINALGVHPKELFDFDFDIKKNKIDD